MESIINDFLNFSVSHSWYKHIPINGYYFYIYSDNKLNWQFTRDKPIHIKKYYKINVSPFIHFTWNYNMHFNFILELNQNKFMKWIKQNYKEYEHITINEWLNLKFEDPIKLKIYIKEREKMWLNFIHIIDIKKEIGTDNYLKLLTCF